MNDILLDSDYELQFLNGDLLIGDSDNQNIEFILKASPGHFYQWPLLGVGIETKYKGTINKNEIRQDIKLQLESDNYRVKTLQVGGQVDELIINLDATKTK